MDLILNRSSEALGFLLVSVIVYSIYKKAYKAQETTNILIKGFLYCFLVSVFAAYALGNPTCEVQTDLVYGGCEEYSGETFDPTTEARVAHGSFFMTLLYLPVVAAYVIQKNNRS